MIGGLSILCGLSVLVLYTKESLPSRLEASRFCVACGYWFCIQKTAFPPAWRPLFFVWLVCIGSIYKTEPSLQIGGLLVLCGLSVLVLYTNESLPSRLEVPLFCKKRSSGEKLFQQKKRPPMCKESSLLRIETIKRSYFQKRGLQSGGKALFCI